MPILGELRERLRAQRNTAHTAGFYIAEPCILVDKDTLLAAAYRLEYSDSALRAARMLHALRHDDVFSNLPYWRKVIDARRR